MKNIMQHKKALSISIILLLIVFFSVGFFLNYGKTTNKDLLNLEYAIDQKKVVQSLGFPKSKTVDIEEILNCAPDRIIRYADKYAPLEMYTYEYEYGEAQLFFSNNLLLFIQY